MKAAKLNADWKDYQDDTKNSVAIGLKSASSDADGADAAAIKAVADAEKLIQPNAAQKALDDAKVKDNVADNNHTDIVKAKEAEISAAEKLQIIADAAWQAEEDIRLAQDGIAAAQKKVADALAIQTAAAKELNDKLQLKLTDREGIRSYAEKALTRAKSERDAQDGLVKKEEAALKALKDAAALAQTRCKGVQYETAQEAWSKLQEKIKSDKAEAERVKKAYDAKVKLATKTDGSAGTRCEKTKEPDAVTGLYRAKCLENLCCGSANKYLRDGTRLTVETCQPAEKTTTYTFLPKLMEGALKEPEPETWRFYCIQGAQRLAATMAAASVAYLMA